MSQSDPVLIDLALQGGGSHGAFTWGVLDRLLEENWLRVAGITTGANGGDCVFLRVKEEGSEECLALWNVDAQSDRRKRDGGALMDRQPSAGYFEVRRTSALMERPLLALSGPPTPSSSYFRWSKRFTAQGRSVWSDWTHRLL